MYSGLIVRDDRLDGTRMAHWMGVAKFVASIGPDVSDLANPYLARIQGQDGLGTACPHGAQHLRDMLTSMALRSMS